MVVVTVAVSIITSNMVAVFVPTVAAVVIFDPAKEVTGFRSSDAWCTCLYGSVKDFVHVTQNCSHIQTLNPN